LQKNCIEYDFTETIPELLLDVAPYESREEVSELVIIMNKMGYLVIRLPPYRCQYNPLELIQAEVKGGVVQLNKTCGLSDLERLKQSS
jgi:hypothetical protein